MGTTALTDTGKVCQRWDAQYPHTHHHLNDGTYLDLKENYCRNYDHERPWCYTLDPGTRWENCPVPRCREYCSFDTLGLFVVFIQYSVAPSGVNAIILIFKCTYVVDN